MCRKVEYRPTQNTTTSIKDHFWDKIRVIENKSHNILRETMQEFCENTFLSSRLNLSALFIFSHPTIESKKNKNYIQFRRQVLSVHSSHFHSAYIFFLHLQRLSEVHSETLSVVLQQRPEYFIIYYKQEIMQKHQEA